MNLIEKIQKNLEESKEFRILKEENKKEELKDNKEKTGLQRFTEE